MKSQISGKALKQKPFALWVQRLDQVFEGWTQQECIDQMLRALKRFDCKSPRGQDT